MFTSGAMYSSRRTLPFWVVVLVAFCDSFVVGINNFPLVAFWCAGEPFSSPSVRFIDLACVDVDLFRFRLFRFWKRYCQNSIFVAGLHGVGFDWRRKR